MATTREATKAPRRPRPPRLPSPAGRFLTRDELALAFRMHPVNVMKWQRAGMPIAERGRRGVKSQYDLAAVVEWRIATELKRHGVGAGARGLNLQDERAKQARTLTEIKDLELQARRGQLLEAADVERVWATHVGDVKRLLEAIPRAEAERCVEVARTGGPADVERVLSDAIRSALTALAGGE